MADSAGHFFLILKSGIKALTSINQQARDVFNHKEPMILGQGSCPKHEKPIEP
jgi:hypothetical protein